MSTLKTRKFVRGTSIWTITRIADELFKASNGWNKTLTYHSDDEVIGLENFLANKGYTLLERGRSLDTLVRS